MTKKDYELIAEAIYGSLIQSCSLDWQDRFIEQHRTTARRVALALERNNPRFNREKFINAGGIKEARSEED